MSVAEPHVRGPETYEVWYQLDATSLLFLGKERRRQRPGEAFIVPPKGETLPASINDTDELMRWLQSAHYGT